MLGVSGLETYLDQLQREGELQSQGRFTVDFERALAKLGGMARQQVHRWVFFAVQAAVGFGAHKINLSANHRGVSVSFETLRPSPALLDGRAFRTIEEKPDLRGSEAAEQNLRQALLWGRALEPRSFTMAVEGEHPGFLLQASAAGMEVSPRPAREACPTTCSLVLLSFDAGSNWTARLQAETVYRLSFSPVPVILDGLVLSRGDSSSLLRNAGRRQGNVKLFERYVLDPDPSGPALAVLHPRLQPAWNYWIEGRPPIKRERSWQPTPQVFHLEVAAPGIQEQAWRVIEGEPPSQGLCLAQWTAPGQPASGLWLEDDPGLSLEVFAHERIRTRALLTRLRIAGNYLVVARHGMLLDAVPLTDMPGDGWVAVVASDGVQTDASGLQAVDDERLQLLKRWVRAETFAIHQRLGPGTVALTEG